MTLVRYTWGMHQYLRRLWRRRPSQPRVRIEIRTNAGRAARGLRGMWDGPLTSEPPAPQAPPQRVLPREIR